MAQGLTPEQALQREAERARYTLRSSFYYRSQSIWQDYRLRVERIDASMLDWGLRGDWGITQNAWNKVINKGINPHTIFAHPQVLRTPGTIHYYRCLALLPEKGFRRFIAGEEGPDIQTKQARVVNKLISLLVEADPLWTYEKACTAALLNLGSQVNGSWRNEIGTEGSRKVKELLVTALQDANAIEEVVLHNGQHLGPTLTMQHLEQVVQVSCKNGCSVIFGLEPDIAIRDRNGLLLATVEIKYGLDPAGALERYGAAKKSFERASWENRRVVNIYLASCFTPELRNRIEDDRLVNKEFNLTAVLVEQNERTAFLKYIFQLLGI